MAGPWERYGAESAAPAGPWARYAPPAQTPDRATGAPANVRAAVGAAQTPADRLATIRRFYPDARPEGSDNFLFNDPRSGRPTLYNPPGLDFGDVASVAPEVGEAVGGMVGGALALPPAVAGAAPSGGLSALAVPAGVGLGAAAGREIATLGANMLGSTVDTRAPQTRVVDAATTAGVNAVAGPLVDAAGRGLRYALGPVQRVFGGRGGATAQDFAESGVRASAGDITGNPITQNLQAAIAASPTGTGRMARFAEAQTDDLGRAVGETAEGIAVPTTPGNAGAAVREGAGRAVERFTARQGDLYDQAFALVGENSRMQFPAVLRLREQILADMAQAPASSTARLSPILQRIDRLLSDAGYVPGRRSTVNPEGMPFSVMRNERTALGRTIGAPPVSAAAPGPESEQAFRRLYAAMSEDMTAHAQAAGGDAARALSVADRYTRLNRTVNLPTLERIQRQGTDEQVYNLLFPRSGRPDAQTLQRTLRNLQPEERRALAATVLDRMGTPNPGAQAAEDFSASTFLTNWNRLVNNGPAARRALFGQEDAELGRSLDRLVRVAGAMRDTQRFTNWSNTGRAVAGIGILGAAGSQLAEGDAGGFAQVVGLGLVAPAVGARLLTSPQFVNWLASAGPTIAERGITPGVRQSLARVGAVNPEIRDAVEAYTAAITSQPVQAPAPASTTPR